MTSVVQFTTETTEITESGAGRTSTTADHVVATSILNPQHPLPNTWPINDHQPAEAAAVDSARVAALPGSIVSPTSLSTHRSELVAFLRERVPDYMVPTAFVLLDALPLTPSGKLDRARLPAPERGRDGLGQAFVAPRTRAEATLAAIWAEVLGIERVGVHDNFFALGGDSIRSIQVIDRARRAGLDLAPGLIFRCQTIAELAAAEGRATGQAEQGPLVGALPFLPVQLWFFERDLPPPYRWFISSLLQLEQPPAPALLREALRHLLAHHDGLRARAVRADDGWRQLVVAPDQAPPFFCYDLSGLPEAEQADAIVALTGRVQDSLSLADGPIIAVALIDLGAGRPARLLIVMHHLFGDAVSWRIVLEDLQGAYRQLSGGEPVRLPPKTSSLRQLGARLAEYAGSEVARQSLEQYWLTRPWHKVVPLPLDSPAGLDANTAESTRGVAVALSAEETEALLRRALRRHDAQIMEVLLAALGLALAPWTGSSALLVDVVGHGRETLFDDLDLSRTVGWLTVALPLLLDLEDARDPAAALRAVKRQMPQLSMRGMEFQALRYLSPDPRVRERLGALPPYEIVFNYLGQVERPAPRAEPVRPAPEAARVADLAVPPGFRRQSLLHCSGVISGGRLTLSLKYSANIHRRETIERVALAFAAALRALIAES